MPKVYKVKEKKKSIQKSSREDFNNYVNQIKTVKYKLPEQSNK